MPGTGLVVGRASYGGVYYGGGASIGHRLERDYEAGYTGPQGLQRCITAKAPNAAGTLGPSVTMRFTILVSSFGPAAKTRCSALPGRSASMNP